MTRSASMTPASISSASPEASLTCVIGTLRTSIGSGMPGHLSCDVCWQYGRPGPGRAGADGVGDAVERGDDVAVAALLDEPAGRLDLRAHAPGREVPLGGVPAQGGDVDGAEPAGPRGAEAE